MVPAAPVVLSTITVWPSDRLIRSARMRASVSVGPPAVNGTTMVICFDGNVSARAAGAARPAASIIRPAMTLLRNKPSPQTLLLTVILAPRAQIFFWPTQKFPTRRRAILWEISLRNVKGHESGARNEPFVGN